MTLYRMIPGAIIILLLTFAGTISAQNDGVYRGIVTDSLSGESLAYTNVYMDELKRGTSTNAQGLFTISAIPPERFYTVTISYVGYATKRIKVYIGKNQITEDNIKLRHSSYELDQIEKIGKIEKPANSSDISLVTFSLKELEYIPKGVESDIFRSLLNIPGVNSSSDVSARYNVRGGSNNQNLVLFNGATIYSPFHALGLFSVIDPETINSLEFYKGGFPSRYSGRLSSVVNVVAKEGNRNKYSASASASFLTGKAKVEGPFRNGSFFISGRQSFSNDILKKFLNEKNAPVEFYDMLFSASYQNAEFVNGRRFNVFGFFSGDRIDHAGQDSEDYKWNNNIFGFKMLQVVKNTPLFYQLSITWSEFKGEQIPNYSSSRYLKNSIRDFTIRTDMDYLFPNNDEVSVGFHLKEITSFLDIENIRGGMYNQRSYGVNISVYGSYKLAQFENFGIEPGLRVHLTRIAPRTAGQSFLEPRLSFIYRFSPLFSIKGGWGRYYQEFTTITNENELISIFEPWIVSPNYLDPASSDHYILGFEYFPHDQVVIEVENYYKALKNIPTINEDKYYSSDPDLIPASGYSYGTEVSLKYTPGRLTTELGYSYSVAEKEVNNYKYYPRFDVRHTANISVGYDLGSDWKVSANWKFNSGYPYTQITGYHDRLYFEDLANRQYIFSPNTILGGKNLGRLPTYHRLDLSISKKVEVSFAKFYFDFSILNAYDRKNIFYFEEVSGDRVNMLPFLPTATVKAEI